MQRTTFAVLFWAVIFAGQLSAQDVELPSSVEPKAAAAEQVEQSASVVEVSAGEQDKAIDAKAENMKALAEDETAAEVGDLEEQEDEEQEAQKLGPAVVSVNEQGELVGQASAVINGDEVPIEANITLVSGGVLLAKTVANEDGSFSFPNIHPGDYNIYGCAASFCGDRACTVVTDSNRFERVQVQLDQTSVCGCNIGYAEAPATSFNGSGLGSGGFGGGVGSGSSFGGGGFGGAGGGGFGGAGGAGGAGGGSGGLLGRRGFRLLTVGGVATAIALGASDDDEVSPSE